MPYIQCKKRKGWHKVDMDICFDICCPHLKSKKLPMDPVEEFYCDYQKDPPKKEKRKK